MKYHFLLFSLLINFKAFTQHYIPNNSILYTYNEANEVFIGKLIKEDKSLQLLYFKVITNYKNANDTIMKIRRRSNRTIQYQLNEHYLIYTRAANLKILYPLLSISQSEIRFNQHLARLQKIPRSNEIKNYPIDSLALAEGNYKNGLPIDEWKYYENTGELLETGSYNKNGKREGNWIKFHTTQYTFYHFYQYLKTHETHTFHELIYHKNITDSLFLYEIAYLDKSKNEEITKKYYFKKPIISGITPYQNGKLHGKIEFFDIDGFLNSYKHYQNNKLHGETYLVRKRNQNGIEYKRVDTYHYVYNKIKKRKIRFYKNGTFTKEEVYNYD